MRIRLLRLNSLRIFSQAELALGAGINVLIGDNGAGKTSVLEAVHLLSRGRSFRSGPRDTLIRQGEAQVQVFADIEGVSGLSRLGLERGGGVFSGRVNERPVEQLSELFRHCKAVCFEPGSHALISGGSEQRRELVDWGSFHVEPTFLDNWRRYQRALRQRNALLKTQGDERQLQPFEQEMARAGVSLAAHRASYVQTLVEQLPAVAEALMPELGRPQLAWQDGWRFAPADTVEAAQALLADGRELDRQRGHSRRGPHRADWTLGFEGLERREHFSRGQEKLAALLMVLAQAQVHARRDREWPILLLDDPASELDQAHCERLLDWLHASGAQVLLTATEIDALPLRSLYQARRFHVEQGRVHPHT